GAPPDVRAAGAPRRLSPSHKPGAPPVLTVDRSRIGLVKGGTAPFPPTRRCPPAEARMLVRRFACVRQNDQSDCGPACLAAVALHYGRPVRLQQMRDLAGTDRVGTNLLGMVQAAERLGFMAKAVKGTFEVLPGAPLPAVAHVRTKEGLGH